MNQNAEPAKIIENSLKNKEFKNALSLCKKYSSSLGEKDFYYLTSVCYRYLNESKKALINLDKLSKWICSVVCWILMPLIFAMTYEVLARKLFLAPTIWAYDISRFLYGALFMLGAGYALSRGCLLYTSPSPRDS